MFAAAATCECAAVECGSMRRRAVNQKEPAPGATQHARFCRDDRRGMPEPGMHCRAQRYWVRNVRKAQKGVSDQTRTILGREDEEANVYVASGREGGMRAYIAGVTVKKAGSSGAILNSTCANNSRRC